jgi:aldehyde:ferredoxin oxidoreductase
MARYASELGQDRRARLHLCLPVGTTMQDLLERLGALSETRRITFVSRKFSPLPGPDDITKLGADIVPWERAFNEAAGFGEVDDRLREFTKYEKLPPHDEV